MILRRRKEFDNLKHKKNATNVNMLKKVYSQKVWSILKYWNKLNIF